jgi:uncharacterized protein (DUF488 family)
MREHAIIGVGYEGRTVDEFIEGLKEGGARNLFDVRLNPVSRKRGFSKRLLAASLAEAGIIYWHVPELGNPKWNRAGFGGSWLEVRKARHLYAGMITGETAQERLEEITSAAADSAVAVMCVEADEETCHRYVLLRELHRRLELTSTVLHG